MYVVKVMHGYIDKTGCRTREKNLDNLLIFKDKKESEAFAKRIGGPDKTSKESRPRWFNIFLFEALIGMPIRAFFADCVFMPTRFVSDLCYNRLYLHRKEG